MDTVKYTQENTTEGSQELPSERIAGTILPRVLSTFDMVAIFVCLVFFATNAAIMSGAGPAAYPFWILGFLTFLIPCAVAAGQLGRLFPREGSIYLWTTKALGPFAGFFAGFCAWFPGVLGLVATGAGAIPFIQYLAPSSLSAPWQQGLVIVGIIAFSCVVASLRFKLTKTMTNVIFVCYGGVVLLLALAGIVAWASGRAASVNYAPAHWWPNGTTWTFYGAVVLGLLGVEVPLNMGVEVKHPRSITRYLLWGSLVIMLLYLLSTFGVLSAEPVASQGNLVSIAEAIKLGFGGLAGQILSVLAAIIYLSFFLFATVVYNYSFARLPFTSGLDRRLPMIVSKVNRARVPWVALLVQSSLAMLIAAVIFILAPLFVHQFAPGELATVIYDVLQAALTVIWCLSLVFLFVDVWIILRKYTGEFARQQLAPGWVFSLTAVIGSAASLCAIVVTFTNPWTALLAKAAWIGWIVGLMLVCLAAGILLFFLGKRTARTRQNDEEIVAKVASQLL